MSAWRKVCSREPLLTSSQHRIESAAVHAHGVVSLRSGHLCRLKVADACYDEIASVGGDTGYC